MSNRVQVYVKDQVVGSVPPFENGEGAAVKAQLELAMGSAIMVVVTYRDVSRINAASLDAARRLPGFSPTGTNPPSRIVPIGSSEAIERGCICKQAINQDGNLMVGADGQPLYAAEKSCPVHG